MNKYSLFRRDQGDPYLLLVISLSLYCKLNNKKPKNYRDTSLLIISVESYCSVNLVRRQDATVHILGGNILCVLNNPLSNFRYMLLPFVAALKASRILLGGSAEGGTEAVSPNLIIWKERT